MSSSSGISIGIDWLSVTIMLNQPGHPDTLPDTIANRLPYLWSIMSSHEYELTSGRKPYGYGYMSKDNGIFVWLGKQTNILIELSGIFCSSNAYQLKQIVGEVWNSTHCHIARVDLACDVGDINPADIVAAGYNNQIGTVSSVVSNTGTTYTIGARTGDRYTKVYQYSGDHPRAGNTRIEFTIKRKYADSVLSVYFASGALTAIASCNKTVKLSWLSDRLANMDIIADRLKPMPKPDKNVKKWLLRVVKPTLDELLASDPAWIKQNVLSMESNIFQVFFTNSGNENTLYVAAIDKKAAMAIAYLTLPDDVVVTNVKPFYHEDNNNE